LSVISFQNEIIKFWGRADAATVAEALPIEYINLINKTGGTKKQSMYTN
jgi:hypothetical protein